MKVEFVCFFRSFFLILFFFSQPRLTETIAMTDWFSQLGLTVFSELFALFVPGLLLP